MTQTREKLLDRPAEPTTLKQLNERAREILRHIVEAYVETGAPIGSRTLSRQLGMGLQKLTEQRARVHSARSHAVR